MRLRVSAHSVGPVSPHISCTSTVEWTMIPERDCVRTQWITTLEHELDVWHKPRRTTMSARLMHRTLGRILAYTAWHSPAEHGLFWDPDGTMPWKELYRVLQEDASLRFVRESHLRELEHLDFELPFVIEGSLLRLRPGFPPPDYPVVETPPETLYYGCRRKQYAFVLKNGLRSSNRSFLTLSSHMELALRIAQRRDPKPVIVQVFPRKAGLADLVVRKAGEHLFLVEEVGIEYILFPLLREDELLELTAAKKKEKVSAAPRTPTLAGSYTLGPDDLGIDSAREGSTPRGKARKEKKGRDWKRESRKERNKRSF